MCLMRFVFFVSPFSSRGRFAGTRNVLTFFCGLKSRARTTCTTHVCHMLFPVSVNALLTSVLIVRLRKSEGCRKAIFPLYAKWVLVCQSGSLPAGVSSFTLLLDKPYICHCFQSINISLHAKLLTLNFKILKFPN
jgi:hypothetical protein